MSLLAMDSLETIEMVMLVEEVFEVEIADANAETFGSPRDIVDWLERRLSNQRPNKAARKLLSKLAVEQRRAELAEGLDELWGREQIAAIVREIFSSSATR